MKDRAGRSEPEESGNTSKQQGRRSKKATGRRRGYEPEAPPPAPLSSPPARPGADRLASKAGDISTSQTVRRWSDHRKSVDDGDVPGGRGENGSRPAWLWPPAPSSDSLSQCCWSSAMIAGTTDRAACRQVVCTAPNDTSGGLLGLLGLPLRARKNDVRRCCIGSNINRKLCDRAGRANPSPCTPGGSRAFLGSLSRAWLKLDRRPAAAFGPAAVLPVEGGHRSRHDLSGGYGGTVNSVLS